jgi:heterodisulfide reductase subunit B
VPTQVYNYEAAVRKIAEAFDIKLVDIADFGCCGELTEAMDYYTALVFSARNIALAEKEGLDVLTLCNGCFASLNKAIFALKDPHLRSRVNETLKKIGLSYKGKSRVFHFHQLMYDVVGVSKIKEKVVFKLNNVAVSCHNGCHILRPNDVLRFDDPENPRKLEELVALTGAKIVKPKGIEQCCGSVLSICDLDTAQSLAIESIERKGEVDAIIVGCPFCFKQFDMGQIVARKKFNKELNIPILLYAELLGLALGFEAKDLGLHVVHKIRTDGFLEKLGVSNG